jgi:putative hydrolase of the HAD superfamily
VNKPKITTLFLDIGGVLLTNGWDHSSRVAAAEKFGLPIEEMNRRHGQTFGTYEEGKITLEEYLDRAVFFKERPFTRDEFKAFMFARSKPYPEMLEFFRGLKKRYKLKTAAVSNEGRELAVYRNEKFGLPGLIDFFVSSCFIRVRKPDADIYRLALDLAQVRTSEVVYVENTEMFVDVARGLGIPTIFHKGFEATVEAFRELGLTLDQANVGPI